MTHFGVQGGHLKKMKRYITQIGYLQPYRFEI